MNNEEEQSYPVTPTEMEETCQKAARYGAFHMWVQLRGHKGLEETLEKVKEIDDWLHNLYMSYWQDIDVWKFEETYQIMCEKGSSTFDESENFSQNMQHCVGRIQKEYGCMSKFFRKVGEEKVKENASRNQY